MKKKITEAQLRNIIQEAVMNELNIMSSIFEKGYIKLNPDVKMDSSKINKLMKAAKIIKNVAFGQ